MNWKTWPYWKKGGSLGLILGLFPLVYTLINFNEIFFVTCKLGSTNCLEPMGYFLETWPRQVVHLSLPIIAGFLIGSIVGYLYNKIKNRNS